MSNASKGKDMPPLKNRRQEIFCREYIIDFNGTQSAIRAGYSKNTAAIITHENLRKPNIRVRVADLMEERTDRLMIDADRVLWELHEILQLSIKDILTDDGALLPVNEWPDSWARYVCGFDVSEIFEGRGDERQQIGFLKKIKWPDKLKVLEQIGKHVDVHAFQDKREISGPGGGPMQIERSVYDMSDEELLRIAAGGDG